MKAMATTLAVGLLLLAGCGKNAGPAAVGGSAAQLRSDDTTPPTPDKATYTWLAENVFKPACFKCHTGPKPAGKLDLSNYDSLKTNHDIGTNPDKSELYKDVNTGKMPKKAPKLADDQIQAIHDWIQAGLPR